MCAELHCKRTVLSRSLQLLNYILHYIVLYAVTCRETHETNIVGSLNWIKMPSSCCIRTFAVKHVCIANREKSLKCVFVWDGKKSANKKKRGELASCWLNKPPNALASLFISPFCLSCSPVHRTTFGVYFSVFLFFCLNTFLLVQASTLLPLNSSGKCVHGIKNFDGLSITMLHDHCA